MDAKRDGPTKAVWEDLGLVARRIAEKLGKMTGAEAPAKSREETPVRASDGMSELGRAERRETDKVAARPDGKSDRASQSPTTTWRPRI